MRWRSPVLFALLAFAGCERNPKCCKTPDCSGGSKKIVGTDVLQFRGRVPKNLLFLSIDTLRKDHVAPDTTPFLDHIASQGLVLDNHFQCSNWTYASMTCTLSGAFDTDRGHLIRLHGPDEFKTPVPDETPFLATWLGEAGFRSAGVTSNSYFSRKWNNHQGYDRFKNPPGKGRLAGPTGLEMLRSMLRKDDSPWFLHLHYIEPHAPYRGRDKYRVGLDELEPWPADLESRESHYDERDLWPAMEPDEQDLLEEHLRIRYAGQVRHLDAVLEKTWTDYDEKCWLDDTLVAVWSDHGEAFWEHGYQTHAHNLTAEENDGVLFFWSKNIVSGVYDQPTSAVDLVPSLLELYGVPIPAEAVGLSFGTAPPDRPIFGSTVARRGAVQSVTKKGYKLQYHWKNATMRLWDRNADPDEADNLYDAESPIVTDLWADLRPQVERLAELGAEQELVPKWPPELP